MINKVIFHFAESRWFTHLQYPEPIVTMCTRISRLTHLSSLSFRNISAWKWNPFFSLFFADELRWGLFDDINYQVPPQCGRIRPSAWSLANNSSKVRMFCCREEWFWREIPNYFQRIIQSTEKNWTNMQPDNKQWWTIVKKTHLSDHHHRYNRCSPTNTIFPKHWKLISIFVFKS